MAAEKAEITSPCIYCGRKEAVSVGTTTSAGRQFYQIGRCGCCGSFFLSPPPTPDDLNNAYDDSYYGSAEAKFSPFLERCIDYFRKGRSRKVQERIGPSSRVLDIGCGNGRFLRYLAEEGYESHGVELPGKAAERAGRVGGLHLKVGALAEGDYPEAYFDAVTLWHVLEHLPEPRQTLEVIRRILKPGGYLFISMPNIESWQSRLFGGRWFHLDPPRHLFFMGPRHLEAALSGLDFRLEAMRHFSLEQNPFGIQQSLLNCICWKREVLFESLKGNREYTAGYGKINLRMQKIFYLVSFPVFAGLAVLEAACKAGGTLEAIFRKEETKHV